MKDLCLGLITFMLVTSAASAQADEGRTHDGFMARFTGGFGYGVATEELDGQLGAFDELKLSGAGIMFSADIGVSPVENLVLHGRFGALVVSNPTVEFDGEEVELSPLYDEEDSSLSFILLGPAVTYYFMPVNIYVTGAFGLGLIGLRFGDEGGRTDPGWALNFDAGWEFWVGQSWGMGPALRFFYTSVPDSEDLTVNGAGGGLLFSATFQ